MIRLKKGQQVWAYATQPLTYTLVGSTDAGPIETDEVLAQGTVSILANLFTALVSTVVSSAFVNAGVVDSVVTVYLNGITVENQIFQATVPAGGKLTSDTTGWKVYDSSGIQMVSMASGPGGGLTDAELRASPLSITGTVSTTGLTDAELRAAPLDVNTGLTQSLTDVELRASPVPVSATSLPLPTGAAVAANQQTNALTDVELRATPVDVNTGLSQPVTDAQIRATPLPVDTGLTPGLTDAELRATPVPVSATNLDIRDLTFAADKVDASGTALGSGTNYVGKVRLTDGTTDAEVVPLANYNAQAVAVVDSAGNQISSFGSPATLGGFAMWWHSRLKSSITHQS